MHEADVKYAGMAALGEDWRFECGEESVAEGEGAGGGCHGGECGGVVLRRAGVGDGDVRQGQHHKSSLVGCSRGMLGIPPRIICFADPFLLGNPRFG